MSDERPELAEVEHIDGARDRECLLQLLEMTREKVEAGEVVGLAMVTVHRDGKGFASCWNVMRRESYAGICGAVEALKFRILTHLVRPKETDWADEVVTFEDLW